MLQGYRLKVRFRIHKYLYDGNVRTLVSRMQKPMLADYSGNAHDPATLCINEKKYLPPSKVCRNMLRCDEITCPHLAEFWRLARNRNKKSSSAKFPTDTR